MKEIIPTLSKSKVKRIGVHYKFEKTKQNEVKPFKIVHDRSKTNVFVIDCEEKRKKRSFVLFWNKAKKSEYNRSSTIKDLPLLAITLRNCRFVQDMENAQQLQYPG